MICSRLFAVRAQRGFTLIELMVALTIGLALTIVVANLFLHSRSTYGTTDELSRMQENIRYTNALLSRMVHHAGYMTAPNQYRDVEQAPANSAPLVLFDAAVNPVLTAAEGVGNGSDGFPAPDSFTVQFQGSNIFGTATPDGTVTDCQGNAIGAGLFSINTFRIMPGANGAPALWCDIGTSVPFPPNAVTNKEIVSNVQNMQLLFGEDSANWQDGSALRDRAIDRYLPIAGAQAVGNINKIVAVRVALLFTTAGIATVVTETGRTYNLNGTVVGPYNDKLMRRAVTMTLNLRNRSF
jgi:type IV pilus assembly protein PilW